MLVEVPTIVPAEKSRGSSPCSRWGNAVDVAVASLGTALADGGLVALVCDHTLEGVLGAVGVSYLAHADRRRIRLVSRTSVQCRLGEVIVDVPGGQDDSLVDLARRVYRGYVRHVVDGCALQVGGRCPTGCSVGCLSKLVYAAASDEETMPECVHRYLGLAFERGGMLRTLVADEQVVAMDELARQTMSECERTRQFIRFSLLGDGSLAAVFRPRANTLPLTAPYFAQRMGAERFCIIDPVHLVGAFHEVRQGVRDCSVVRIDRFPLNDMLAYQGARVADGERDVRALWRCFYQHCSLPGRGRAQRGYDLRAAWMPKRFWDGLVELGDNIVP